MKRAATILGLTVTAVAALAAFAWVFIDHSQWFHRQSRTISTLNKAYVGVIEVESHYKRPITDVINSDEDLSRIGRNRAIALLFEKEEIWIASKRGPLQPLELLDPFGNPICCLSRDEAVARHLPADLIGKHRTIIMYSTGPNGKNELGHGDDIYWPEP